MKFNYFLIVLTVIVGLLAGFTVVLAVWTEPTAAPPNNNIASPLTQSTTFSSDVSGTFNTLTVSSVNYSALSSCTNPNEILEWNGSAWVCTASASVGSSQTFLQVLNVAPAGDAKTFTGNVYIGDSGNAANLYVEGGEFKSKWIHITASGDNTIEGSLGLGKDPGSGIKFDVLGNIVASGTICDSGGTNCIGAGGAPVGGGWTDDGTDVRLTTVTDSVGIGTADPNNKLHVSGSGIGIDIGAARDTASSKAGLNIHDTGDGGTYTNIQLAERSWSGSQALLFNAYKKSSQVDGSLATTGNTVYANDVGSYSGGAGNIMFFSNSGIMDFYISPASTGKGTDINWGNPKMRILRDGSVGIGATGPDSKLEVEGGRIHVTHDSSSQAALWVTQNNSSGYGIYQDGNASSKNYFGGSVGISDSTPDTGEQSLKLDVEGAVGAMYYCDENGDNCTAAAALGGTGDDLGDHTAVQNIILNGNWLSGDGGNEGIQIDSTGNVGIGTTQPNLELEIKAASGNTDFGNDESNSVLHLQGSQISDTGGATLVLKPGGTGGHINLQDSNGNSVLYTDGTNNWVGIGVTTPISDLNIKSTDNLVGIYLHNDTSGQTTGDGTNFSLFENDTYITNRESGNIFFWTGGAEQIRITNNGRVGLSDTSPGYPLDIGDDQSTAVINIDNIGFDLWTGLRLTRDGSEKWFIGVNATDDKFRLRRDASSYDFVIDSSGRVGIGDDTPSYPLDVTGNIRATGNLIADGGVSTGSFALKQQIWTGNYPIVADILVYISGLDGTKISSITCSVYDGTDYIMMGYDSNHKVAWTPAGNITLKSTGSQFDGQPFDCLITYRT